MKSREIRKKSILKAFTVLSSMTLLSRITGYARDAVVAAFLGASLYSDAFFVAFRIPNMFRRLFGEGGLTPAIVPVVTNLLKKEEREREIRNIIGTLMLIVGIITLIGIIFAPYLVKVLAYGFSKNTGLFNLTVNLTRITFPYLFFISLVAIFMGILNSVHHFFAPSFSPVLLNLSMIGSLILLRPFFSIPVYALACGVVIGGILQLIFQIPYLNRYNFRIIPSFNYKSQGVREVFNLLLPSVFGLGITQINVLVDTLVASFLKTGTVSYLYYADRILELPIGIFTVSFASALLPTISLKAQEGDIKGVKNDFNRTLVNCMIFIIPSMVFFLFFGKDFITILFRRKAFDVLAEEGSYRALVGYSFGLPFFTFNRLITPLFYAYKKAKDPVKAGFIAMLVNIVMDLILMPLGEFGLAFATTLSAIANAVFLYSFFKKNHYKLEIKESAYKTFKILISALLAIILVKFPYFFVSYNLNFIYRVIGFCLTATVFLLFYLSILYFFKLEELKVIWKRLAKK